MIKRHTYLKDSSNIHDSVLMYGAGTQSTAMTLMLLEKGFDVMPTFGVFSDTGGEPDHVLDYMFYFSEYVFEKFGFKIHTVKNRSLLNDLEDYLNGKINRVSQIPLYTETGILFRQCTEDYKINVADKFIKTQLKIKRKNKEQKNNIAVLIGLSLDEIHRMRISQQWWKVIIYPLIEKGFRRLDSINYVKRHGLKEPPRSACWFCPFHSDSYWKLLYDNYPKEFDKAVALDERIRNYPNVNQKCYLHKSRIPLKDVKFNQLEMFDMDGECNGYCGI